RGRGSCTTASPPPSTRRPRTSSAPRWWPSPATRPSRDRPHRQLRLLHLQPGASAADARGGGRGVSQRHHRRGGRARPPSGGGGAQPGTVYSRRGGHLRAADPCPERQAAHPRGLPRPPVDRSGLRGNGAAGPAGGAREGLGGAARRDRPLRRAPPAAGGGAVPLAGGGAFLAARLPGGDRHRGGRRGADGPPPPEPSHGGRAVPSGEHPHAPRTCPPRKLPPGAATEKALVLNLGDGVAQNTGEAKG